MLQHRVLPQSQPLLIARRSSSSCKSHAHSNSSFSSDEEEVLFDLDEIAMSHLPRHLQDNMREIQTERLHRLQRKPNFHTHTHSYTHQSQPHQQNQTRKQWFAKRMTRVQTAQPAAIADGGFWALSKSEQRAVAPWMAADITNDYQVDELERLRETAEFDSDSLTLVEEAPKVRNKPVAAPNSARTCSPHLRRPRRRDLRPPRSAMYECNRAGQAEKQFGKGQLRRSASSMLSSMSSRLRRRMSRMSEFFTKL